MRRLWHDHSVLFILGGLLAAFLIAAWFLGIPEWTDQQKHDKASTALWPGYAIHWSYDVVVSMLADIFGPLLVIGLGLRWYDRRSKAQDGDG